MLRIDKNKRVYNVRTIWDSVLMKLTATEKKIAQIANQIELLEFSTLSANEIAAKREDLMKQLDRISIRIARKEMAGY